MTTATTTDRAFLEALIAGDATAAHDLREWACEAHKDFHGMKGRWAFSAPIAEVIDWLVSHFRREPQADGSTLWANTIPFEGE